MGLSLGAFVALWALMMTAMMLPTIAPFAALYTRTLTDHRPRRISELAIGYLLVWTCRGLPAYALALSRNGWSPPDRRPRRPWPYHLRSLRHLSADPDQGPLPGPVPLAARLRPEVRQLPRAGYVTCGSG